MKIGNAIKICHDFFNPLQLFVKSIILTIQGKEVEWELC